MNVHDGNIYYRPICRTVEDAVYVLDVIAGFDPRDDEATREGFKFIPEGGYKQFLKNEGLKGKILGVVRSPFVDKLHDSAIAASFEDHLSTLSPCTLQEKLAEYGQQTFIEAEESTGIGYDSDGMPFGICFGGLRGTEPKLVEIAYGFEQATKVRRPPRFSMSTNLRRRCRIFVYVLDAIVGYDRYDAWQQEKLQEKTGEYGQDDFLESEKTNGIGEVEKKALLILTVASKYGFERLMRKYKLDALVTPLSKGSRVLAIGGYPGIDVPAGYNEGGTPYGICFGGLRGSEPKLIEIAYGFEQASKVRKPPSFKP
ncbi:putative amidase [Camellia lanceoleosa]|uniref:Amidase n=1 Tax=Camellia lanceoleosa TaxID=1840588 RepID=A0ACC0IPT5_9ERIC|nr:putative amidase [Camellia lanceoleosa]